MKVDKPEIKKLVLNKAAELIFENGVKGWSTADLAQKSGLAKNTLYKIIGSKEKLIETIAMEQVESSLGLLASIIREESDYQPAMKRMRVDGPDFAASRHRVILQDVFAAYPAVGKKVMARQRELDQVVYAFIIKGQDEGSVRKEFTPEFMLDMVRGLMDHYTRKGLRDKEFERAFSIALSCMSRGVRVGNW